MVGAGGTAERTVVEDDVVGQCPGQMAQCAKVLPDVLRLVAACGNREMAWQDRVGVDEHLVVVADHQGVLLGGTVLVAEEAGARLDALLVNFGACGDDAGGVPLHRQLYIGRLQRALLHVGLQGIVVALCQLPVCQLLVEEAVHVLLAGFLAPSGVQRLTGTDLCGTQLVLVEVVLVHLVGGEGCVAVALPTAAQVELIEDAANAVAAPNHEAQRIVLAITGVGNLYLAQHWRVECTRGA